MKPLFKEIEKCIADIRDRNISEFREMTKNIFKNSNINITIIVTGQSVNLYCNNDGKLFSKITNFDEERWRNKSREYSRETLSKIYKEMMTKEMMTNDD